MLLRRGALLIFKVIRQISTSHGSTKKRRCWLKFGVSVKFEAHTGRKLPIVTRIERFRTVTSVLIHWWIWNYAQSLMLYRRGAIKFFEVIHQISRSHGLKHRWFGSNLSKITRPDAAIKSIKFALFEVKCPFHFIVAVNFNDVNNTYNYSSDIPSLVQEMVCRMTGIYSWIHAGITCHAITWTNGDLLSVCFQEHTSVKMMSKSKDFHLYNGL